jgi:hypothetical protein
MYPSYLGMLIRVILIFGYRILVSTKTLSTLNNVEDKLSRALSIKPLAVSPQTLLNRCVQN